jgi:hypothetical protein
MHFKVDSMFINTIKVNIMLLNKRGFQGEYYVEAMLISSFCFQFFNFF